MIQAVVGVTDAAWAAFGVTAAAFFAAAAAMYSAHESRKTAEIARVASAAAGIAAKETASPNGETTGVAIYQIRKDLIDVLTHQAEMHELVIQGREHRGRIETKVDGLVLAHELHVADDARLFASLAALRQHPDDEPGTSADQPGGG